MRTRGALSHYRGRAAINAPIAQTRLGWRIRPRAPCYSPARPWSAPKALWANSRHSSRPCPQSSATPWTVHTPMESMQADGHSTPCHCQYPFSEACLIRMLLLIGEMGWPPTVAANKARLGRRISAWCQHGCGLVDPWLVLPTPLPIPDSGDDPWRGTI